MSGLVLDAGALIALDRNDRGTWSILRVSIDDRDQIAVPVGTIAQVWRDGARQANLTRALQHCREVVLSGSAARAAGVLCGRSATTDVIDASVAVATAMLAHTVTTVVLTSDPHDIQRLLDELGSSAFVERV